MYSTLDCYIAGYLAMSGFAPHCEAGRDGRVVFVFTDSFDLQTALTAYRNGVAVSALAFASAVKNIKSQMFNVADRDINKRRNDYDKSTTTYTSNTKIKAQAR